MSRLIATALKWLLGKLGLLVVILAILLVGSWLRTEWEQHRAAQAALGQQESMLENLRGDLQSIEVAIAADQAEWRRATAERMRTLWDELDALNGRIQGYERSRRLPAVSTSTSRASRRRRGAPRTRRR